MHAFIALLKWSVGQVGGELIAMWVFVHTHYLDSLHFMHRCNAQSDTSAIYAAFHLKL